MSPDPFVHVVNVIVRTLPDVATTLTNAVLASVEDAQKYQNMLAENSLCSPTLPPICDEVKLDAFFLPAVVIRYVNPVD